jgi:hypothetical protein
MVAEKSVNMMMISFGIIVGIVNTLGTISGIMCNDYGYSDA